VSSTFQADLGRTVSSGSLLILATSRSGFAAAKYPNVKTICHSIDFSAASNEDYAKLGRALDPLPVGVLSQSPVLAES